MKIVELIKKRLKRRAQPIKAGRQWLKWLKSRTPQPRSGVNRKSAAKKAVTNRRLVQSRMKPKKERSLLCCPKRTGEKHQEQENQVASHLGRNILRHGLKAKSVSAKQKGTVGVRRKRRGTTKGGGHSRTGLTPPRVKPKYRLDGSLRGGPRGGSRNRTLVQKPYLDLHAGSQEAGPKQARLSENMRQRANRVIAFYNHSRTEKKDYKELQSYIAEFLLPGGSVADASQASAADADLQCAESMIINYRAVLTWKRYIGPWRIARGIIANYIYLDAIRPHNQFSQCGYVFGWNATTFDKMQTKYVPACMYRMYAESPSLARLQAASAAITLVMKVNNIVPVRAFLQSVIADVANRELSKDIRKKFGVRAEEVRKILDLYGHGQWTLVMRMIAVGMALMFMTLLRFSDLCMVHAEMILVLEDGIFIGIVRRKNRQKGPPIWLGLADSKTVDSMGRPNSAVAMFKELLQLLGYVVPQATCEKTEGFVQCGPGVGPWVFRHVRKVGVSTHDNYMRCEIAGDGSRQLDRSAGGYSKYLNLFRRALRVCCGMSKSDSLLYGTQSCRSGGDTHLFDKGANSELRCEIGDWKTPSVEKGYLRLLVKQRLQIVKLVNL